MVFIQAAGKLWCYQDQATADRDVEARKLFEPPVLTISPSGSPSTVPPLPAYAAELPKHRIPEPPEPKEAKRVEVALRDFDPQLLAVKELYTLEEVAALTSMGASTVERMVLEGYLASGIVPGTSNARRVSRAQLGAFITAFNAQNGLTREERTKRPRRVKK